MQIRGIIQEIQIHSITKAAIITEDNNPVIIIDAIHVPKGEAMAAINTTVDQITSDNTTTKDVIVNTIPIQEITAQTHMVKATETKEIIQDDTTMVATKVIRETIPASDLIATDNR